MQKSGGQGDIWERSDTRCGRASFTYIFPFYDEMQTSKLPESIFYVVPLSTYVHQHKKAAPVKDRSGCFVKPAQT
ncbi:MAG: hypothetical protein EA344_12440 [Alkalicoccus sp.]|nr:MAG: hypothetical protein EA344_12440 [Alkalicoccus sp.]